MKTLNTRNLSLIAIATITLSLASCSSTDPGVIPYPNESSNIKNFKVEKVSGEINSDTISLQMPFVTDLHDNNFILVDGGSGSCPSEIETINLNSSTQTVEIEYKQLPPETACTEDYVVTPQKISFSTNEKITSDFKFTVKGIRGDVSDAPVMEVESF